MATGVFKGGAGVQPRMSERLSDSEARERHVMGTESCKHPASQENMASECGAEVRQKVPEEDWTRPHHIKEPLCCLVERHFKRVLSWEMTVTSTYS